MSFSKNELKQILDHGLSPELVEEQLSNYKNGFPYIHLKSISCIGDGILSFSEKDIDNYVKIFDQESRNREILKFVPSSGAATRMFKDIYKYLISSNGTNSSVKITIDNLEKFAFYNDLKQVLESYGFDLISCIENKDYKKIFSYLVLEKGLNYGNYPKALIPFHRYGKETRRPIEEHLVEGGNYSKQGDGNINIHFTVSPEHLRDFERIIYNISDYYNNLFNAKYNISLSEQKSNIDIITVWENNELAKDGDGNLIFRPAGHGALIENLNEIKGDIVFIKNIDNISIDSIRNETYKYKKLLGGILLSYQKRIFSALKSLDKPSLNAQEINDIIVLCNELEIRLNKEESNSKNIINLLHSKLNRPIRVCGMVVNQSEPGGGPFWVENNNNISLQIIEKPQVDLSNPNQKEIFQSSTHFNPVDIVCGLKNYKNESFDLLNYVDKKQGFITRKTLEGREIKTQELPGLWNGSMADWISLFVEVPIQTFTPVKEINDLLRYEHQEQRFCQ